MKVGRLEVRWQDLRYYTVRGKDGQDGPPGIYTRQMMLFLKRLHPNSEFDEHHWLTAEDIRKANEEPQTKAISLIGISATSMWENKTPEEILKSVNDIINDVWPTK